MDMKDWPEGTPSELMEMWHDSRQRAAKAKKIEGWKDEIADRIHELLGFVEERPVSLPVAFDTGLAALNALLGSGLPVGVTEVFGASSTGKSSLAYQLIGAAQVAGLRAVLCATQRPPADLMKRLGVNTKELCLLRARHLEDAVVAILDGFVAKEGRLFLVVDTATGLRPEVDGPGMWTHIMEGFLAGLANDLSPCSAALIVNEVRARRSVDPAKMFAGGTDSAARRAARMIPTRLELHRDSVTEEEYSLVVRAVASQNRPPQQYVTMPARKGRGVDAVRTLVETGVKTGVVASRGMWLYFDHVKLGAGARNAADELRKDEMESTLEQLYVKVQSRISGVEELL